ncbi:AFG1-like ATPase-domain-containing protein [Dunaliella salina]|uniref:AFG1-like ATPase-domain-containing protein n=1 Tax=Dunaliella salina TaxID=3046 RepID=A0ABQ7GD72_DUNSA|nr:AFG1-like ATPase-domain-containing protein [Dunaliella salina]|eukprot:KAF5832554.1 AFG1-like ATPase-domain-containing protein [Dunaliella salina]
MSGLLAAWLPAWLVPAGERTGRQVRQLTPMQREHLRKARLREQVLKELGNPPTPPSSPKGVYLYGSVGSGKTLLMDIFYSALAQNSHHLGITKHRRVHFNTAMLEIHKLLHDQDQQQRKAAQQGASQQQHDHHHHQQQQQREDEQASSSSGSSIAGALDGSEDLYESGRMRRSFGMQGDEVAQQQKTSKKAVMAIRKYLSLSRMGRISPEAVAAANSRCVALAAAGLLESSKDMHKLETKVLCFDEMQVADVFSAVALKGIVEWITSCGGVMILTSNRAPEELPRHGLHEGMFSHFVDALNNTCDVLPLSSSTDYRMQMLAQGRQQQQQQQHAAVASPDAEDVDGLERVYASPLCPATQEHLNRVWARVTQGAAASNEQVPILFGRTLSVRKAAQGAAFFHFAELCAAVTGPADFTALAQHYHTLFIHGVPAMSMQIRDQARRFITLVDELYNNKQAAASGSARTACHFQGA